MDRPLEAAISGGNDDIAELLIRAGALVHVPLSRDPSTTLLHCAGSKGNLKLIQRLLEAGLNPNERDMQGWTVVTYAASGGHVQVKFCFLSLPSLR